MSIAPQRTDRGDVLAEGMLRTGAWYSDSPVRLSFPPRWKLITHWPDTPPPLSDGTILESLENPIGQAPIREICRGKQRPLILVDDPNRPTPAYRILPPLLQQFSAAGIPASRVTILIARGSHGEPQPESILRKLGPEAASQCRILLHDPYRNTVNIGRTSFGTPVRVSEHVVQADFVMGIGGVYPNNTAGFGGGAKLAIGVLDIGVISRLHSKHSGVGWGNPGGENTFRQDLEEIARMIGLESLILAHVDAARRLVRIRCGDYRMYYNDEVAFARQVFRAPSPGDADVVIANAFPCDLSLTFVHMKGVLPLGHTVARASRIVLAACSEGEGLHGVYPIVHKSRPHEQYQRLRRIARMGPGDIARKIAGRLARTFRGALSSQASSSQNTRAQQKPFNPIWLYRTGIHHDVLPSPVKGMRVISDWQQILDIVRREQGGREDLKVVIYPCAPLQVLE